MIFVFCIIAWKKKQDGSFESTYDLTIENLKTRAEADYVGEKVQEDFRSRGYESNLVIERIRESKLRALLDSRRKVTVKGLENFF